MHDDMFIPETSPPRKLLEPSMGKLNLLFCIFESRMTLKSLDYSMSNCHHPASQQVTLFIAKPKNHYQLSGFSDLSSEYPSSLSLFIWLVQLSEWGYLQTSTCCC
jgi:hypothetical protein